MKVSNQVYLLQNRLSDSFKIKSCSILLQSLWCCYLLQVIIWMGRIQED
jgi:hypothetical protein